jgi:hypothetical protein
MRLATALVVLATLSAPLAAQSGAPAAAAHPDFSGHWVLNPAASEGMGVPESMTMQVTQNEKTLKLDRSQVSQMGTQSNTLTYNLDGTAAKNTVSGNGMSLDLNTTSEWQGAMLQFTTTADVAGQTFTQIDHWSLDPDGKTLHITSDVSVAGQSAQIKLAFAKQ